MIHGSGSPYQVKAPMTYDTSAALYARGRALLGGDEVVFDLAGVPQADSAALSVMLGWQRAAGAGGVRLINLPKGLILLAKLYGVFEMLPLGDPPSSANG